MGRPRSPAPIRDRRSSRQRRSARLRRDRRLPKHDPRWRNDGASTAFPITTMPRTLLDLACFASNKALARAIREAIRLERTTMRELGDYLGRCQGRRGMPPTSQCPRPIQGSATRKSPKRRRDSRTGALARCGPADASTERARAGEEADLSWPREKLIIEIDGGPFHQDKGEDARKEAAWRGAGWRVERIPSDDVYERPAAFLALAPHSSTSVSAPYRG